MLFCFTLIASSEAHLLIQPLQKSRFQCMNRRGGRHIQFIAEIFFEKLLTVSVIEQKKVIKERDF